MSYKKKFVNFQLKVWTEHPPQGVIVSMYMYNIDVLNTWDIFALTQPSNFLD